MKKLTIAVILSMGLLPVASRAADISFQLDPVSGVVYGQPGTTVGWGFTISSPTDYLLITDYSSVTITQGASLGVFTDYLTDYLHSFDVVGGLVIGPNPTPPTIDSASQAFDPFVLTGAGSFVIDPSAPVSGMVQGVISFHYALYAVDPNSPLFDPFTDNPLVPDGVLSAAFTVDVVPEPATLWLIPPAAFRAVSPEAAPLLIVSVGQALPACPTPCSCSCLPSIAWPTSPVPRSPAPSVPSP